MLAGEVPRFPRKVGGRANVGRQVAELTRQVGAFGDSLTVGDAAIGPGPVAGLLDGEAELLELGRGGRLAALHAGETVERVLHGFGTVAGDRIGTGLAGGRRQVADGIAGAGAGEPDGGGGDGAAVGAEIELGLFAAANDQHAGAGQRLGGRDEKHLAGLLRQVPGPGEALQETLGGAVELGRGSGQLAAVEDTHDGTLRPMLQGASRATEKLHTSSPGSFL